MNQTPNYQLSQWEADDKIQRVDFNADNAKIDTVLKAAEVKANEERIYIGEYKGNGGTRTIQLPWEPALALVLGSMYDTRTTFLLSQDNRICMYGTSPNENVNSYSPLLTGSTIQIRYGNWCNNSGMKFWYIIFR